ncbi:hypothetical protein E2562_035364 [Oryza meyeriana var. granulata]|uniref:Uncharacterized protein n=1 Tax=Oryza meyeriana var. granulata TaxID=110450 RepID=A0A6G1E7Q0_9ORYZ|nr:hypothetical protein E2562_035364 [Oryza meyeriana var. granulata]
MVPANSGAAAETEDTGKIGARRRSLTTTYVTRNHGRERPAERIGEGGLPDNGEGGGPVALLGEEAVAEVEGAAAEPAMKATRLDSDWSNGERQPGLVRVAEPSGSWERRRSGGLWL